MSESRTSEQSVLHATGSDGQGRTLCGVAIEGTHDDGFKPIQLAKEGRFVSCADCMRIINHCQLNHSPHGKVRFFRG